MSATLVADLLAATSGSRQLSDRVLLAMGWLRGWADGVAHHDGYWRTPDGRAFNMGEDRFPGPDPTRDLQDCADVCSSPEFIVVRHGGREASASFTMATPPQTTFGAHAEARARCAAAVAAGSTP